MRPLPPRPVLSHSYAAPVPRLGPANASEPLLLAAALAACVLLPFADRRGVGR